MTVDVGGKNWFQVKRVDEAKKRNRQLQYTAVEWSREENRDFSPDTVVSCKKSKNELLIIHKIHQNHHWKALSSTVTTICDYLDGQLTQRRSSFKGCLTATSFTCKLRNQSYPYSRIMEHLWMSQSSRLFFPRLRLGTFVKALIEDFMKVCLSH